jgi:hypothetical protein
VPHPLHHIYALSLWLPVCTQGTSGFHFYVVLSGSAGVYVRPQGDPSGIIRRLASVNGDKNVGNIVANIVAGECAGWFASPVHLSTPDTCTLLSLPLSSALHR